MGKRNFLRVISRIKHIFSDEDNQVSASRRPWCSASGPPLPIALVADQSTPGRRDATRTRDVDHVPFPECHYLLRQDLPLFSFFLVSFQGVGRIGPGRLSIETYSHEFRWSFRDADSPVSLKTSKNL